MILTVDTTTICKEYGGVEGNYSCQNCGYEVKYQCFCLEAQETIKAFCLGHNTIHEVTCTDIISVQNDPEYDDDLNILVESVEEDKRKITFSEKCRHYNISLTFPEGTTVYASSIHDRNATDPTPDFGLYLDTSWSPACYSSIIGWPDYSIPSLPIVAVRSIADAFNKASKGLWVEVGCIGGHGRTGTVLACMGVLSGLSPEDSISYVREFYCDKAIENIDQEWFVYWFDAYVNGGTAPVQRIWDSKKKIYEDGPVYSYVKPFDWENYDPFSKPQGGPPEEIVEVVVDRYFSVPCLTKKGYPSTRQVRENDKEFKHVALQYLEQEENCESIP